MRHYWNLPSHLAWTSDAQNLILSFVSTTEVFFFFFHSQPYFGFSILINKMHFKLVSSFFYSAGETERGGLVSVWCNVLGQHKTFFVASPKKNHIQLWVKASQNLPTILFWLLHWKKFINHSEVCCYTTGWVAICFCAFLGAVRELIAAPHNFLSFLSVYLFVCVHVSTLLLIPAQTRVISITGHCQKRFCTSCPSFPIRSKLAKEILFKVFAVVV